MDAVITGCERSRRNLVEVQGLRIPIYVIPPLDFIPDLPVAEDRTYTGTSILHFGLVGRLGYGKGVATLLDIWPQLEIGRAVLHFHGLDPDNRFRKLAQRRGLGDSVRFHGPFRREELPSILARLDLGLMLSFEEGYGLVVWEYMACGLPFVMTDVGASWEFTADNPDGLAVPANKQAIKAGLEEMARRLRAGEISRKRLQQLHRARFSYDGAAKKYLSVLLQRERL